MLWCRSLVLVSCEVLAAGLADFLHVAQHYGRGAAPALRDGGTGSLRPHRPAVLRDARQEHHLRVALFPLVISLPALGGGQPAGRHLPDQEVHSAAASGL